MRVSNSLSLISLLVFAFPLQYNVVIKYSDESKKTNAPQHVKIKNGSFLRVQIVAAEVDRASCEIVEPVFKAEAGMKQHFTISTADKYKNKIDHGGVRIEAQAWKEYLPEGSEDVLLEFNVKDRQNGLYDVFYTGKMSGTYISEILVNGEKVDALSPKLTILPGLTDPAACIFNGEVRPFALSQNGLWAHCETLLTSRSHSLFDVTPSHTQGIRRAKCGEQSSFSIVTKDRFGNIPDHVNEKFQVFLQPHAHGKQVKGHDSHSGTRVRAKSIYNGNGEYRIEYLPRKACMHQLFVFYNPMKKRPGWSLVRQSYFTDEWSSSLIFKCSVDISAGVASASNTTAKGNGLGGTLVGRPGVVSVNVRDTFGHSQVPTMGQDLSAELVETASGAAVGSTTVSKREGTTNEFIVIYRTQAEGDHGESLLSLPPTRVSR